MMILNNLLKQLKEKEGLTYKQLADRISKNKSPDDGNMDIAVLNRYILKKWELSEERMVKILRYGFGKTKAEAEKIVSQYVLEDMLSRLPNGLIKQSLKRVKGWVI